MDPTHVQWMWCVNHTDNGPFTAEEYYPGDAFVDWVAVDGYNWGQTQSWSTWSTPAQIYGDMLHRLRRLTTKPLAIPEYATTTSTARGQDIAAKSQWIAGVHQYMLANDVRLAVWFNLEKETDWAIFGGSQGDGVYVEPPFLQRLRPWQIVGAVVIVVFVLGEVVFVTRLVT
jgi:beta-mannanase